MAALTPRENRRWRALATAMRVLDVTDQELATRIGVARSAVQARRKGGVKLREDQIEEMAAALDLPPILFDFEPHEVVRWLADNRPEQVFAAAGWFSRSPEFAAVA